MLTHTACFSESLRVEIECRQEEQDEAVDIDLDTASHKAMAKIVNQVRVRCQYVLVVVWFNSCLLPRSIPPNKISCAPSLSSCA